MYLSMIETLPGFEVVTAANVVRKNKKIKSFLSVRLQLQTVQGTLVLQGRRTKDFFFPKEKPKQEIYTHGDILAKE